MKTTLLLTVASLAIFSSACRTVVPVDPMTGKPSLCMMPDRPALSTCTGRSAGKCTSCTKGAPTIKATK